MLVNRILILTGFGLIALGLLPLNSLAIGEPNGITEAQVQLALFEVTSDAHSFGTSASVGGESAQ